MNPTRPDQESPALVDDNAKGESPVGQPFDVKYSFPESVEIRLVEASGLLDYEIWLFIASLLSNFVVGFVIAATQAKAKGAYIASAAAFGVFFVLAVAMAVVKRRRLGNKTRKFRGPVGGLIPESPLVVDEDSIT